MGVFCALEAEYRDGGFGRATSDSFLIIVVTLSDYFQTNAHSPQIHLAYAVRVKMEGVICSLGRHKETGVYGASDPAVRWMGTRRMSRVRVDVDMRVLK